MLVHHYCEVRLPGFQKTLAKVQENYFSVTCQELLSVWSDKITKEYEESSITPDRGCTAIRDLWCGPLPTAEKGNKYSMTMQDHFTRWPEAYASSEATAKTVVEGVQSFARDFNFLDSILLDRGSSFVSKLGKKAHKKLKILKRKNTVCRQETNGLCERFHGTMKTPISVYIIRVRTIGTCSSMTFWQLTTPHHSTPHTVPKEL